MPPATEQAEAAVGRRLGNNRAPPRAELEQGHVVRLLLYQWYPLSFSARRPRPSGLGMNGALARRVLHCLHTAGPAGIYACGAGPTTKAPMNVSAGHSVLPSGEHAWSAVFSPGIPCL